MRVIMLLLFLLLASLTACRNVPSPTMTEVPDALPAVSQPEQITVTLAVADANLAGYQPLIEQFEAQYSHIQVRLVAESEIISSEQTNRIADLASAADVFVHWPSIQDDQQYLLDLGPFLSTDPTFDSTDFLPGLLDAGNSLWSLPTAASYPLIYFNKTAFDAAGLAYPEPGWTLDEFLAAAQALTQREGDEVVQWGYVPFQVQPLLATQLAAPLVVDGELRLTDPDVAEALQWLADLFVLHEVSPWLENYKPVALRETSTGPDPISLVREGWAAMWSADHTVWQLGFEDENVGLTTISRSQQGYAADAVRYGFAISRGTVQPQAAWQLLTFLSQQPPVDSMIDLLVPARRSVAAAGRFWEQLPAVMVEPLQYATDNNTTPRFTPAVVEAIQRALTAVVTNHHPATDALAQAQAATSGQLAVSEREASAAVTVATPLPETTTPTILFATSWDLYEAHQELARAFNESQVEFQVTVQRIDSANNFYTEIAGADCFAAISSRLAGIEAYSRPINALFDLEAEFNPEDFYPGAISALTMQGEMLGLPGQIAAPLIAYNRNLFTIAGVDEPSFDWTMAGFLEIAQALTDPAVEQYGFTDWSQTSTLYFGMAQFGVSPISANNGMVTVDFKAVTPAVRWYVDLIQLYEVHPVLPGDLILWQDFFDRHALFVQLVQNNQVAMWPNGNTPPDDLPNLDIGLVPFPLGPSGYRSSLVDSLTAYFIAADTTHIQPCWQWLQYLVTQPTAVSTNSVPAHLATAESAAFADHVGAEKASLLLAAAAGGWEQAAWFGQFEPWLDPAMIWLSTATARAARGEIDVDSVLAEADDKFARYRSCVIDRQAFEDQAEWQACALEVDPDLAQRYEAR
jgi:ABC-type glycerol-3-phosphate transport system substrate-binding protein